MVPVPPIYRVLASIALLAAIATTIMAAPGGRDVKPASAAAAISFSPTTLVDDQRLEGEPSVKVCGPTNTWSFGNCGQDNPYASMPWGVSTGNSFLWRSEDQAQTFKLVPSNLGAGTPIACPGGGDTDIGVSPGATQASDFVTFADMQALTNFSMGVSSNGGQSWTCNPASSASTLIDRQWLGFYRNQAGAPANGAITYMDYDVVAGPTCVATPGAAGNEFIVEKSTDGGLTFAAPVVADCNDGTAGNIQVNQSNGYVYAIHTAYTPSSDVSENTVVVDVSTDQGATWRTSTVFKPSSNTSCPSDCTVGQDFAVLAIDKSGGLYAVWSQATTDSAGNVTGPSHIYYSYSGSGAKAWTPERQVDTGVATNVDIFPWAVAGNAGAIDIVWYGTTKSSSAAGYDPGVQTSDWYPYLSQSLNANSSTPVFSTPVRVAQHSNHNGGICTMGLGCTSGGDRSLLDFFQVDVNREGGADVIWADTSNNGNNGDHQGSFIDEARQLTGPSLYATTLTGTATDCTAIVTTPCMSDKTGDARYEANGIISPNIPKLDITGSSVNIDPADPTDLDVRMNVPGLTSPPTATDAGFGPNDNFIDYLTTWNYHIPGNTQASYDSTGNIYYAYLEVNRSGTTGTINGAYDGDTCSIATTQPKYLVYPGQSSIKYKIDYSNGTIDLYVPLTDVGRPPAGATLYSVTGHTVGQAAPAGPFNCSTRDANGNNQDPSGQIFDVYDKTPAYTAVLTAPPTFAPLGSVSARHNGHEVVFRWRAGPEHGLLGFNLLIRRHDGLVLVNHRLIKLRQPARQYVFRAVLRGVRSFYLESVLVAGPAIYGPFKVRTRP